MSPVESTLVDHLDALLGYARKKTGDPDLAADVLQQSLLRALEAAPSLHDSARVLPWFYRILDNTLTDLYRRRGVEARYRPVLAQRAETSADPDELAEVCRCLDALLPGLNPEYALLIATLELGDEDPQTIADRLGITRNHLKVKRYRARQQLKQRLEEACRTCAEHGCLDCSCRR